MSTQTDKRLIDLPKKNFFAWVFAFYGSRMNLKQNPSPPSYDAIRLILLSMIANRIGWQGVLFEFHPGEAILNNPREKIAFFEEF